MRIPRGRAPTLIVETTRSVFVSITVTVPARSLLTNAGGPDGARCDVDGNLWCSSNAGRAVGYNGVTVWNPQGRLIGRVRLPEVCANVSFGGPKRNRLFMVASQSLYAVHFNTQGASPA